MVLSWLGRRQHQSVADVPGTATGSKDPALTNLSLCPGQQCGHPQRWLLRHGRAAIRVARSQPHPHADRPRRSGGERRYEYDTEFNLPAYMWNGPAMANSLMAYFDCRLNQDELELPVDDRANRWSPTGTPRATSTPARTAPSRAPGSRMVDGVRNDDSDYAYIEVVDDTTYVWYGSKSLPLVEPLRLLGEPGNMIAGGPDRADMRAAVNYGYPYNDLLATPDEYVPARLVSASEETKRIRQRVYRRRLGGAGDSQRQCAGDNPDKSKSRNQARPPSVTNETTDPAPTTKRSHRSAPARTASNFTPKPLAKGRRPAEAQVPSARRSRRVWTNSPSGRRQIPATQTRTAVRRIRLVRTDVICRWMRCASCA